MRYNNKNVLLPKIFVQLDEIWYTSSDGNIVTPNKESSLPTIVSNTYVNGKGVLKFTTNVTSIGSSAFNNCTGLTSIMFPNSVTSFGEFSFYGCTGLSTIIIPSSVTSIEDRAFEACSGLTSLSVEEGNTVYDSRNNCNAIIKTSNSILILGCQNTIIPNNVARIGFGAFRFCTGLTSITFPDSVVHIMDYAFEGCKGLTNLLIGNSIKDIGSNAFHNCTGLTSVTIPVSVTEIYERAFYNCTSLTSISYTGTQWQYTDIVKWSDWHKNVPATVVHCTDGDISI